ncbi:Hypothetical predicted protein [Olea europaea subsp. europaea]|uniref:Uncharacterized protein n=1 Tax=Olea europaea subsp. europaea TaxID=158383 RepID=A0A8S0Q0B5_OLEEU|nr:Hypothetical predicted protein [Olea europaea subsp. europaea]
MSPPNSPRFEMAHHHGHGLHMGSYMGEFDLVPRNQQLCNIERIESKTWRINIGGNENYECGPLAAHRGYSPRPPPPSQHTGGRSFPLMLQTPSPQLDIHPPNHHHGPPGPPSNLGLPPPDHHHCPPRPSSPPCLRQWGHHYDLPVPAPRLGLSPPNYLHTSTGPPQYSPVNGYGYFSDENPNDCPTM